MMVSFVFIDEIYLPKQLELKLEHPGDHAILLDLDMTNDNNIFVYKLFDKWDKFLFFIIRMPYLFSNIPLSILYGSIFSEFLRIALGTLRLTNCVHKTSQLYTRMVTQGRNKASILCQIKNAFHRYPETFAKYCNTYK